MATKSKQDAILAQLFARKDEDGNVSTTYLWYNLINAAVTMAYIFISYRVAMSADPDLEGFAFLTLVVSAVVTGNKFANKVLEYRYGGRGGNHEEYNINVNRGKIQTAEDGKPTGKKVESHD